MTNEELIQAFPECEKVKRGDMRQCIIDAIEQEKLYSEAMDKIYAKANELYPIPGGRYNKDYPGQDEYWLYFSGEWPTKRSPFKDWLETFKQEFIDRHGQLRSFEEACQVAADEWARMIFGNHIQNNGDQSSQGGFAMVLGTLAKDKAKSGYGSDVINKFKELMKQHYLGGCRWKFDSGHEYTDVPYCDYHPSASLYGILIEAGCDKDDANNMCPWKTGMSIDSLDNSVCVRGYQTAHYM